MEAIFKHDKGCVGSQNREILQTIGAGEGHKVDPIHTTQISLKSSVEFEGAISSLAFDATLWHLAS